MCRGASGHTSKRAGQVRPKVPNGNTKSVREVFDLVRPDIPLALLDKAKIGPRNSCLFANILARQANRIDVGGDIHSRVLHYVNFSRKRRFT